MTIVAHPLLGRWRIVSANLWGRDHLDLCALRCPPHRASLVVAPGQLRPATLVIRPNGDGEIAFGALQASLDVDYGPDEIGFTWGGFDEMDEVTGEGSAELQADGSLQIEFGYHNGDEAVLKAVREPSSTAC